MRSLQMRSLSVWLVCAVWVAVGLAGFTGCSSAVPVQWKADAPPAPQDACTTGFDAVCETKLLEARISGDTQAAGQLVVGAALAANTAEARALLWRLALHWNPSPWVPEAQRAALVGEDGEGGAFEALVFGPGDVLALGEAKAEGIEGVKRLPLGWSGFGERQLGSASDRAVIASMWAQAAGAVVAVMPGDAGQGLGQGAEMVVPVAPHLERLLGMPMEGFPLAHLEAARAIAAADHLLTAGDGVGALLKLNEAAGALEKGDAAACRGLGLLHYARLRVGAMVGGFDTTPYWEALKAQCTEAQGLSESEQGAQAYLQTLLFLQENHANAEARAYRPVEWQVTAAGGHAQILEKQTQALDKLRGVVGARAMGVVEALWGNAQRGLAHGDDPCGRHQPLDAALLDESRDRLSALGREDLAQSLYNVQLGQYQAAGFARTDAWLTWTKRWPWLEASLLESGLFALSRQYWLVPTPQANMAVCEAHTVAQLRNLQRDTSPGFEGRLARLWLQGAYWMPMCGPDVVSDLWAQTLLHSQKHSAQGLFGVLSEVFSALNGYQLIVTQLASLPQMAHGLSQAVRRVIAAQPKEDGTSADHTKTERATLALLDIAAQQARQWLGGAPSEYTLDSALKGVVTALGSVNPAGAGSARYAPFLRLMTLTAWASAAALTDSAAKGEAIKLLEDTLNGDLGPLLAPFEATIHAPTLQQTALALVSVLRAADDTAALKALSEKLNALPPVAASDKLGLLLEIAQIALRETHGALLFIGGDTPSAQQSWDAAAQQIPTMGTRFIEAFDAHNSGFKPFLSLLPIVHHMIISGVTSPDDVEVFDAILSDANRALLQKALNDTEQQLLSAQHAQAPMLLAVVRLIRDSVAVPDFLASFDDTQKLAPIAQVLVDNAEGLSPALQAALHTFAGMIYFPQNPARATALWQQTRTTLADTLGADFDPRILTVIELSMMDNQETSDPDKMITLLDSLISSVTTCDRADQITYAALLPWRATLLGRLGQPAAALADLDQYLALVGQGYSGASEITCHFESQTREVLLSFDIKATLGADLRPLSGKQASFNFGFQTNGRTRDVISCVARPIEGYRFDVLFEVMLLRAAYAMRAGDNMAAQRALQNAIYEGLRLTNATYHLLGPSALAASASREGVNVALIRQVATLAMASGHVFEGTVLQELATTLLISNDKASDDEPDTDKLTWALRGLDDLKPAAVIASVTERASADFDALNKPLAPLTPDQLKAWQSIPHSKPWTLPLASVLTSWHPARPGLHQSLLDLCTQKKPPPLCKSDPADPLPHASYKTLLDATRPLSPDPTKPTPSLLSLDEYVIILDQFTTAQSAQAIYRLSQTLPGLIAQYPPDAIFGLMDRTLKAVNPDQHPLEYALILSSILGLMGSPESIDNYENMLTFIADTLADRIPHQNAFQYQLGLFNLLGRLQRHDQMLLRAPALYYSAARLPDGGSVAAQLGVIFTMLRQRAGELPLRELDAWLAIWERSGLDPALTKRLQSVRAALPSDPDQARSLATQIVNSFFQ